MSIKKITFPSGSTNLLVNFLNVNKEGTFLEDATITYNSSNYTLTISKGDCTFAHVARASLTTADRVLTTFTTSTGSDTWQRGAVSNASASFNPVRAILCNNALILDFYHTEQNITTISDIILTQDSTGNLTLIRKNADYWINSGNTYNLRIFSSKSYNPTILAITPTFNTQKSAIISVVINTINDDITLPAFYVSIQSQLPGLGLQGGRMDSTDYITNGYCFIRDE